MSPCSGIALERIMGYECRATFPVGIERPTAGKIFADWQRCSGSVLSAESFHVNVSMRRCRRESPTDDLCRR